AVFSEETPSLILKYNYCRMCDGFPCISSCPTGALVSPPNGERIVIGKATIECKFCLRKKGEHCTICVDFCSKKFNALEFTQPDLPPSLVSERCTGCGECEYHCPAKPESAISITAI
ncbi:4Fe-4S binding protein, partial [bacterium]|nr:4Fe-4S binding protein [bacterium]